MVNRFLDYELSAVHPKIIEWQGVLATKKNLKKKIDKFVTKALDADKKIIFQILELQNRKMLLVRLDETKNSVDIYFSSFSLIENQEDLVKQIKLAYAPKTIENIYFTDSRIVDLPQLEVNHYTYAGKIALIKQSKKTENDDIIELTETKDISFYPEYIKMYAEFYEDFPKLKTIIGDPESLESIKYLLENGLIKLLNINNEIAGVIIGLKMNYDEMSGYFVCDKILSRKYRGIGLGTAMEKKFIDSLIVSENELIFGTINSKNPTSFRASAKVGRICVRLHYKISC